MEGIMTEIWKDVIGYEGLYQVSNLGRVWSFYIDSPLNLIPLNDGYVRVRLSKKRIVKPHMVHRLVAEAFIPNPNALPYINHKNGNKRDNHVDNLEWCTGSKNIKHAYSIGLMSSPKYWNGKRGKNHPCSKQVVCVELESLFDNAVIAASLTNLNANHIRACCRGERKTHGGYHWRWKV